MSDAEDWIVQNHKVYGYDKRLILNTNNTEADQADFIGGVHTNFHTVFTVGSADV